MKINRKQILPFVVFFGRHLKYLFYSGNFSRVEGIFRTCYRHYCPSLITEILLSVLPRTVSAELPLNYYKNTKRHQRKDVVARKSLRIWKKEKEMYLLYLLRSISSAIALSIELEL
jgi:hypothetical protein